MLQPLAPDLWTCPVPLAFGGVQLGGRMTVLRLPGGLLLHSPVAPTDALVAEVRALGEPRWLVAPNDFHHHHLGAWPRQFPQAHVWGSTGVPAKQKGLSFTGTLQPGAEPGWGTDLPWLKLEGMPSVNEVLLFHAPSRTLIATDFMFHLPNRSGITWMFAWANGVSKNAKQTPYFKFNIKDRAAYTRSVAPIRDWDVDRISLTHHEVVETGGRELVATTLGWPK